MRIRMYSIEIALVVILASAVGYFAYLGYGLLSPSLVAEPFSGEQAMSYVTKQMEFGERITGTDGNVRMGDWLVDELRTQGWDVLIQPFTVGDSVAARNIIAIRSTGEAGRLPFLGQLLDHDAHPVALEVVPLLLAEELERHRDAVLERRRRDLQGARHQWKHYLV